MKKRRKKKNLPARPEDVPMMEQVAGFFEKAVLEVRQLCERHTTGSLSFGKKPSAKVELPTGHIELAGCG